VHHQPGADRRPASAGAASRLGRPGAGPGAVRPRSGRRTAAICRLARTRERHPDRNSRSRSLPTLEPLGSATRKDGPSASSVSRVAGQALSHHGRRPGRRPWSVAAALRDDREPQSRAGTAPSRSETLGKYEARCRARLPPPHVHIRDARRDSSGSRSPIRPGKATGTSCAGSTSPRKWCHCWQVAGIAGPRRPDQIPLLRRHRCCGQRQLMAQFQCPMPQIRRNMDLRPTTATGQGGAQPVWLCRLATCHAGHEQMAHRYST
jgi:hypothetical protein